MTNYQWMQIIQKDIEPLKQWYQSQQPKGSLLYWAMKKGDLAEQSYFDWAQDQYGLAYLKNDFFQKKTNQTLWQKYVNVHKWTNECFPVAEWDGTLFIACLQPPEDLPNFPKMVPVLAHPDNLDLYWKNYNTPGNLFELEDTEPEQLTTEENKLDESEDQMDAPAGFDFSAPVTLTQSQPETDFFAAPVIAKVNEQVLAKVPPPDIVMPPTPSELNNEFALDNELAVNSEFSADNEVTAIKPIEAKIAQTANTPNSNLHSPQNIYRDHFQEIFAKAQSHYQKCMLFRVSGNSVVAADWDSQFHATNSTEEPISLNQPSIFRIVKQTMKPYHGYIAVNDINEKYFDEWNQSQIPDHVTVVPVMNNEKVIGMLVGFADKNINKKQSLTQLEKLADETSALMQKLSQTQKSLAS